MADPGLGTGIEDFLPSRAYSPGVDTSRPLRIYIVKVKLQPWQGLKGEDPIPVKAYDRKT